MKWRVGWAEMSSGRRERVKESLRVFLLLSQVVRVASDEGLRGQWERNGGGMTCHRSTLLTKLYVLRYEVPTLPTYAYLPPLDMESIFVMAAS